MQLVGLALVLCVMAMWMMMMMMSDLADSLWDISRPFVVGWSGGWWMEGIEVGSTVSGEAGKLRRVLLQHFCCNVHAAGFRPSLSLETEKCLFSGTPTREEVVSYTMDGQTASHAGLLIASPRAPVQFPPQNRYGFLRNRSRRISET